jgi:hypothetical protein
MLDLLFSSKNKKENIKSVTLTDGGRVIFQRCRKIQQRLFALLSLSCTNRPGIRVQYGGSPPELGR